MQGGDVAPLPRQARDRVVGTGAGGRPCRRIKYYLRVEQSKKQEMSLQCGIVGLPNVGKSTLFNCLSSARAQAANFPFCTIDPNVGVITVPDDRLDTLVRLVNPRSVVPAVVEIVDIAGLVKGASQGEGLGNKFLSNIRETDAIIHVLRCFEDPNIVHVDGSIDPARDKETIDMELQLKDLETVEHRVAREEKRARSGGDARARQLLEVLFLYREALQRGEPARSVKLDGPRREIADELMLLTNKPVLYVCNVDEASARDGNKHVEAAREVARREGAGLLVICAGIEAEIAGLDSAEEKQLFLQDLGLEEAGVNKLVRAAYALLDLRTYFTAGPKEVRAWTFRDGIKAPRAAGIIHSDFERGFIRAEVIKYVDYVALGSEARCKEAGKVSVEGKDYVVQDGDVMHFRFNV